MTPIAREFSQRQIDEATKQICLGGKEAGIALFGRHPDVGFALAVQQECQLNHLTAQVEEAREIILHSYITSPNSSTTRERVAKRDQWLSANPVRTEEKV